MERWFVYRNQQKLGPFTASELREELREGRVEPFDLVCLEGSQVKRPLVEVDEIFQSNAIVYGEPTEAPIVVEEPAPTTAIAPLAAVSAPSLPSDEPPASGLRRLLAPLWSRPAANPIVQQRAEERRFYLRDGAGQMLGPLSDREVVGLYFKGGLDASLAVVKQGSPQTVSLARFVAAYAQARRPRLKALHRQQGGGSKGEVVTPAKAMTIVGVMCLVLCLVFGLYAWRPSLFSGQFARSWEELLHRHRESRPDTRWWRDRRVAHRPPAQRAPRPKARRQPLPQTRPQSPRYQAWPGSQTEAGTWDQSAIPQRPLENWHRAPKAPRPEPMVARRRVAPSRVELSEVVIAPRMAMRPSKRPFKQPKTRQQSHSRADLAGFEPPMPATAAVQVPAPSRPMHSVPPVAERAVTKPMHPPVSKPRSAPAVAPIDLASKVGQVTTLSGMRYSHQSLSACPLKCRLSFSSPSTGAITVIFFKGAYEAKLEALGGGVTISGMISRQGADLVMYLQGVQ